MFWLILLINFIAYTNSSSTKVNCEFFSDDNYCLNPCPPNEQNCTKKFELFETDDLCYCRRPMTDDELMGRDKCTDLRKYCFVHSTTSRQCTNVFHYCSRNQTLEVCKDVIELERSRPNDKVLRDVKHKCDKY